MGTSERGFEGYGATGAGPIKATVTHTLLLADDSITIRRVIELTFADRDVSVVAVADGDSALRVLAEHAPDIVLADVDMPGPTGYDIARHVQQTPALRHVPVLLLTGAFEPIDEAKARASGSTGVLTKPFEPEEVIRKVSELLAAGRTLVPAVAPAIAAPPPFEPPSPLPAIADLVPVRSAPAALDDYFDQLDRAFADRLAATRTPEPAPLVLEPLTAETPIESSRPLLATAFSALLDAEQSDGEAATIPEWMVGGPDTAPTVSEALIEQITRQVLARMSDRVVRETVAGLVSATAERLVLEEIERIKSNIK